MSEPANIEQHAMDVIKRLRQIKDEDVGMGQQSAMLLSIAISLKRIADQLDGGAKGMTLYDIIWSIGDNAVRGQG